MPGLHFSSRQVWHIPLHALAHFLRQNIILRRQDIQRRLPDGRLVFSRKLRFVLPVDLASAVPVARSRKGIFHVFGSVVVELLIAQQRRTTKLVLLDHAQIHARSGVHEPLPALWATSIHPLQELSHARLVTDGFLERTICAAELQLVAELRENRLRELLSGDELGCGRHVRRADAEDVRDKVGIPLRDAIHGDSTLSTRPSQFSSTNKCGWVKDLTHPIMATNDDLVHADAHRNARDGIGVRFEAKVLQVPRRPCLTIAHAVQRDAAESELQEQRNLVAPAERYVRKAVD